MRAFWTIVHRWLGLITAAFLFFSGVTGAVISWDHELDEWLNPHLHEAHAPGTAIPSLELARRVEQRHPQVRVTYTKLGVEPGESLEVFVQPRIDPATGRLFEPGFNTLFLDPVTGEELGRRQWGAIWPLGRENLVSFLYKLHFTLHMPEIFGSDRWGVRLLGVIAIIWTIDCFVGLYLTLPARRARPTVADGASARSWWQRWKPSWMIRWRAGPARLQFDLHRALSLWTWGVLLIVAFTAFSLNLYREVFYPVMAMFTKVTPTPFDQRPLADLHRPIDPKVGFEEVLQTARTEAERRGWTVPAGAVSYAPRFGLYTVFFFEGDSHGAGGVGPARLYFDSADGSLLGQRLPWQGTVADIFVQAQFPLHSGRILGLPGRVLISALGMVVAVLSVTGVLIWWRKRKARIAIRKATGQKAKGGRHALPGKRRALYPATHAATHRSDPSAPPAAQGSIRTARRSPTRMRMRRC